MSGMISLTNDQHYYLQSIGDAAPVWGVLKSQLNEDSKIYAEAIEDLSRYLSGSAPASPWLQEILNHRAL